MSRERELLERALSEMDDVIIEDLHDWGLPDEIRDFLSTPEPTQDEEPVASRLADELHYAQEIIFEGCGYKLISPEDADEIVAELRRLHPAPRPDFVRLSEEELRDALRTCPHDTVENIRVRWLYAKDFTRAIEDALKEKNRG